MLIFIHVPRLTIGNKGWSFYSHKFLLKNDSFNIIKHIQGSLMSKAILLIITLLLLPSTVLGAAAAGQRQQMQQQQILKQRAVMEKVMQEQKKAVAREVQRKYGDMAAQKVAEQKIKEAQKAIAIKKAAQAKAAAAQIGAAKEIMEKTAAVTRGVALEQKQIIERIAAEKMAQEALKNQPIQEFDPRPITEESADNVLDVLSQNAQVWRQIIDDEAKIFIINFYKEQYYQDDIYIRKPSFHYVELIDEMYAQTPEMLNRPFEQVLQLVAIMEYDFDNGTSPDDLARQVLGDEMYEFNRQRITNPN